MMKKIKNKVSHIGRIILLVLSHFLRRFRGSVENVRVATLDFAKRFFGGVQSRKTQASSLIEHIRSVSHSHKVEILNGVDIRRRTFLKYAFFGGAVFLVGKYINPLINALRGDTVLSEKTFENFKIIETGKKLLVTDDDGSEILTIDKESF